MKEIIKNVVKFGTRQGAQAKSACEYLYSLLKENKVTYKVEIYDVDLPVWKKYSLKADGRKIACLPTGLTSGSIQSNDVLTSSLISSRYFLDTPHVNFNPKSSMISQANFSFAPSLAISRDSLMRVCSSKKIEGQLVVEKKKQKTYQILVGNIKNPKNIVFSHFDSIGKGAVDNASGTALMVEVILTQPEFLKDNLFLFDGNEELSYDKPVYWGKGYRNFEARYARQMSKAQQLIVVDCIGYAKTEILQGKSGSSIIPLAFPIKNCKKYGNKITLITSDYNKLMNVYHSDADDGDSIQDKFMKEAAQLLRNFLC